MGTITRFLMPVVGWATRLETRNAMRRERQRELRQFFHAHPEAERMWAAWCREQ